MTWQYPLQPVCVLHGDQPHVCPSFEALFVEGGAAVHMVMLRGVVIHRWRPAELTEVNAWGWSVASVLSALTEAVRLFADREDEDDSLFAPLEIC